MASSAVSDIRPGGLCFSCSDHLNSKWVTIAGCIGVIVGLIILSLGANYIFGPLNSPGFISSLCAGSALTVISISLIILNLFLLRRREYYPPVFNQNSSDVNDNLHEIKEERKAHGLEINDSSGSSKPPLVPLKEIRPVSFKSKKSAISDYTGPFCITTANVGMLPSGITFFQSVGHAITGLSNPKQEALLDPASKRAPFIADKLAGEADTVPILCCQEVFDTDASNIMAEKLVAKGYNVLYRIEGEVSFVSSGLLFATRYPINEKKIRFWKFTNLTQSDAFSSKGLLRIPIKIKLDSGVCLKIVIYTTHLQAQTSERHVRKEQLEGILSLIQQDHAKDPARIIFLVGDLNISDHEYDGTFRNEYTENQPFFSQFYDFVQAKYGRDTQIQEPQGTFYKMDAFGTEETASACFYDRILLYKESDSFNPKSMTCEYSIAIRTLMSGKLSDHLPVTLAFKITSNS
jgi:exonuclease III